MSRQSRLIVVLAVMAVVGVSSLAFVANQYRKTISAHPVDASADAARKVGGFLAARNAVRAVDARYPGGVRDNPEAVRTLRNERYAACAAHGMTLQDYAAVRDAWRAMRSNAPVADSYLANALRAQPAALTDAALRPDLDELDGEIR